MPELPEVEIVTRNLNQILQPTFQIKSWIFFRKDLRFAIPIKKLESLKNKNVLKIERRAKYIQLFLQDEVIISHLGMTGAWRVEKKNWLKRTHDHVAFEFKKDYFLVYEDARRFGFLEVVSKMKLADRFKDVGLEPLLIENATVIYSKIHKLNFSIKTVLMSQKYIVGVGNIYASEVLFKAKVSPFRKSADITIQEFKEILKWTKQILKKAIRQGGSTIENYRNGFGEKGSFQNHFLVYAREGENCILCENKIKSKTQAGRSTFWCSACQK